MLIMLECENCKKYGSFSLYLRFEYQRDTCEKCHHCDDLKWDYYFCDLNCLTEWMAKEEISTKGFPCLSCELDGVPTGFDFGFEENGTCYLCQGEKRVKVRLDK